MMQPLNPTALLCHMPQEKAREASRGRIRDYLRISGFISVFHGMALREWMPVHQDLHGALWALPHRLQDEGDQRAKVLLRLNSPDRGMVAA